MRTAYVCDLPMTHRIGMWWQLAALASAPSTARRQRAEKESYICSLLRAESEYVWRTCVMKRIFRSTVYAWTFRGAVMLMTEGGGRAHLHLACGTARKLHRRGRVPNPVRTSLTACMVFICCYRQLPHRFMRPHPHATGRSVRRSPGKRCVASRHVDSGGVQSHSPRQPRTSCIL